MNSLSLSLCVCCVSVCVCVWCGGGSRDTYTYITCNPCSPADGRGLPTCTMGLLVCLQCCTLPSSHLIKVQPLRRSTRSRRRRRRRGRMRRQHVVQRPQRVLLRRVGPRATAAAPRGVRRGEHEGRAAGCSRGERAELSTGVLSQVHPLVGTFGVLLPHLVGVRLGLRWRGWRRRRRGGGRRRHRRRGGRRRQCRNGRARAAGGRAI